MAKNKILDLEGHILVVDDTVSNLEMIKIYLRRSKIQIEFAQNGEDAFNLILEKKFDLIFLDIEMPIMNGLEAIKKIRVYEREAQNNNLKPNKIVALSAHSDESKKDEIMSFGFDFYMNKPVSKEQLHEFLIQNLKK